MDSKQTANLAILNIKTLGELKASGYQSRSVKEELRENYIARIRRNEPVFTGIWGYENTVVPELGRAILSMHNISLLGLRGQAKTRIARMMTELLDEYIPCVAGSELNDDPFAPLSRTAKDLIAAHGEDTPISWLHRSERYTEKLATPDVSIADLIGDVDPIKAAALKLPYSDERVIHFGLIPRSNRGIFVINELPDLQARIQVALFNILQEGDIQIRGFKLRLPLDVQFVFTANPEDYTNRGSIVTPLKDRIESQIVTHYPKDIQTSRKITEQESSIKPGQNTIHVNDLSRDLIEQIAFEARESEYVDSKSGVSARMTITAFETMMSAAELRVLINNETETHVRVSDLFNVIPAICGKVELVYEGEIEGPIIVAHNLIARAIRSQFLQYFPDPSKYKKQHGNPYLKIMNWFEAGNQMDIFTDLNNKEYRARLLTIDGLDELVEKYTERVSDEEKLYLMEFVLHGMAECSLIGRQDIEKGVHFRDLMSTMFSGLGEEGFEDEDDNDNEDYDDDDDDQDNLF